MLTRSTVKVDRARSGPQRAESGPVLGRVGPAQARTCVAPWLCHAAGVGSPWVVAQLGLAHGGLRVGGPWTEGTVHGGPSPPLPLSPSVHEDQV
jgi:hypothetical protein